MPPSEVRSGERVLAVLSMLHEPPTDAPGGHSATRPFLGRPAVAWTLERLARSRRLAGCAVLCWADQADAVSVVAGDATRVLGDRVDRPDLQAIAAARRWADGWRGGLLMSAECDLGFDGSALLACAEAHAASAVLLVDPASVLLDVALVEAVIERGLSPELEYSFTPAAPGLGAVLLRTPLLKRLSTAGMWPGRILSYQPEAPLRDPLGSRSCVDPPLPAARTICRFKADGRFASARLEQACLDAGGPDRLTCESLVSAVERLPIARLPRDVTLELTTRRHTMPVFSALRGGPVERPDLGAESAARLFAGLAGRDDLRLTLGGVGDPLLHADFHEIVHAARRAGIGAVHVETDLLCEESLVDAVAELPIDVLSVHVPALSAATYAAVMGADGLARVARNIERLLARRRALGRGTPVLAPTFVKCAANVAEMEGWFDGWLRVVGSAVIVPPPGDFGGRIADVSVGDMSPARRVPCRRLAARMSVLSDGTVVSCELDVTGSRPMGTADDPGTAWVENFGRLRSTHADRKWDTCELCSGCREWHRP